MEAANTADLPFKYKRCPKITKSQEEVFYLFGAENPLKDAFHAMELSMKRTTLLYCGNYYINECHFSNVDAAIHNL